MALFLLPAITEWSFGPTVGANVGFVEAPPNTMVSQARSLAAAKARNPRPYSVTINWFQLTSIRAFTSPLYRAWIPTRVCYKNVPWRWRNIPAYSITAVYNSQGYLSNFVLRALHTPPCRSPSSVVARTFAKARRSSTVRTPKDLRPLLAGSLARPWSGSAHPSSRKGWRMSPSSPVILHARPVPAYMARHTIFISAKFARDLCPLPSEGQGCEGFGLLRSIQILFRRSWGWRCGWVSNTRGPPWRGSSALIIRD